MEPAAPSLKKSPLHARHTAAGARMTAVGGWELPAEFSDVSEEHLAVRTRAAIFDMCHVGEIEIAGADVLAGLQHITCNDASRLAVGQAQYSAITTPDGTFVDDVLVYRLGPDHFLLFTNAANTDKVYRWVGEHTRPAGDVVSLNSSTRYGLLAVQGPKAADILQTLTAAELATVPRFGSTHGEVASVRCTLLRTGDTGEDGFEILMPASSADRVWTAVLEAGQPVRLVPAGTGAADTLRLEAGLRLYGNDIDGTTTILEAGLENIIGWDKGDFIGREALDLERHAGPRRRLVGFETAAATPPPRGADVYVDGSKVGAVTSAARTTSLNKTIGLACVAAAHTTPGTDIGIEVEGARLSGRIVPLPFYERPELR